MADKQVNVLLSLKDRFSIPMFKVAENTGEATKSMKKTVAQMNRGVKKFENQMDGFVKSAFKWTKRIGIAGAGISLKVGWDGLTELDDGARKVKSIAKEALSLQEIQQGLLTTSGKMGVEVSKIADAQYTAISSSVDPKESLKYAELAVKMSKAGFADAKESISLVSSMQNAFGEKGIKSATKMADQFLHTQNRGMIQIGQMTQHYGKLIPLFAQANLGYDELNAGMATLTKMGMKPAEASTALAGAIRGIIKPTEKAQKALASYGLEFSASALEAKGFGGVMQEVIQATGGDMDKISQIFPNARAMLAGATLSGKEGMEAYNQILGELRSGVTGSLDEAFEQIQGSIGNQWDILKQNLKNVNTKFYMQYEGNLAEKLREINQWFENNPEKIEAFLKSMDNAIGKLFKTVEKLFNFIRKNYGWLKMVGMAVFSFYGAIKGVRLAGKIAEIVDTIKSLMFVVKPMTSGLPAIAGLAKKGSLFKGITGGLSGVVGMLTPLGKVIIALTVLGTTFGFVYTQSKKMKALRGNKKIEIFDMSVSEQIVETFSIIGKMLQGIWNAIKDIFSFVLVMLGKVGSVFKGLGWGALGGLQVIMGFLSINKDLMHTGFRNIVKGASTMVSGILGKQVDLEKGLIKSWEFIKLVFKDPAEAWVVLKDSFSKKWKSIRKKWGELTKDLKERAKAEVEFRKNVAQKETEEFKKKWASFKESIEKKVQPKVEMVKNQAERDLKVFNESWDTLKKKTKDKIKLGIESFKNKHSKDINKLTKSWSELKEETRDTIQPKIEVVKTGFKKAVDNAKESWNNLRKDIDKGNTDIKSAFDRMAENGRDSLESFREWQKEMGKMFDDLLGDFIDKTKEQFSQMTDGLTKLFKKSPKQKKSTKSKKVKPEKNEELFALTEDLQKALETFRDKTDGILGKIIKSIGGTAITTIFDIINSFIQQLTGVIQIVDGLFTFLGGVIKGDTDKMKEGVKQTFDGIETFVEGKWERITSIALIPAEFIVRLLEGVFPEKAEKIRGIWDNVKWTIQHPAEAITKLKDLASEKMNSVKLKWIETKTEIGKKAQGVITAISDRFDTVVSNVRERWRKLKEFMQKPITGTIKAVQGGRASVRNTFGVGQNWRGTDNWRGGLTYLHEKGGEIYDLPQGTRVYPHDESVRMAMADGISMAGGRPSVASVSNNTPININVNGNVYGEDDFMDKVGNRLVEALKEINNM